MSLGRERLSLLQNARIDGSASDRSIECFQDRDQEDPTPTQSQAQLSVQLCCSLA